MNLRQKLALLFLMFIFAVCIYLIVGDRNTLEYFAVLGGVLGTVWSVWEVLSYMVERH